MKNLIKRLSFVDIVLIVIFALSIVVGSIKFSRKSAQVYVQVLSFSSYSSDEPYAISYWIGNSIKVGDPVYDSVGRKVAEVVKVDTIDFGGRLSKTLLKLKVDAVIDKSSGQYRLNDEPLEIGNFISLNVNSVNFYGMLTYLGQFENPKSNQYEKMNVTLKSSQIQPWLAAKYDKSFVVTNSSGEEIFKITDVQSKPAELTVETATGNLVKAYDPILKDVVIKADILVRCQMDVCYYNEVLPVKIGLDFWTQSKTTIIEGANTKVIDLQRMD